MASTTAVICGVGALGTAPADWKTVTVERFAGFIQVLPCLAANLIVCLPT